MVAGDGQIHADVVGDGDRGLMAEEGGDQRGGAHQIAAAEHQAVGRPLPQAVHQAGEGRGAAAGQLGGGCGIGGVGPAQFEGALLQVAVEVVDGDQAELDGLWGWGGLGGAGGQEREGGQGGGKENGEDGQGGGKQRREVVQLPGLAARNSLEQGLRASGCIGESIQKHRNVAHLEHLTAERTRKCLEYKFSVDFPGFEREQQPQDMPARFVWVSWQDLLTFLGVGWERMRDHSPSPSPSPWLR